MLILKELTGRTVVEGEPNEKPEVAGWPKGEEDTGAGLGAPNAKGFDDAGVEVEPNAPMLDCPKGFVGTESAGF